MQGQQQPVNQLQRPKTAFDLIKKVGSKGKYQYISLCVWSATWFICGNLLLATPFLFYQQSYVCEESQISHQLLKNQSCNQYVCSLPIQKRNQFLNQKYGIISIANQNGNDYHCQNQFLLDSISSLIYFGCLFGYLSITCFVDNLGRKFMIIITSIILITGMLIVVLSNNIYFVGLGLFLMGVGGDSGINICFYIISQTVSNKLRQRFQIVIQGFFCVGGLADVLYFYLIKDWRLIFWFCYIIPMVLLLIAIVLFIQQTPIFLLSRYPSEIALKSLNRIGQINSGKKEILSIQDIQSVKRYHAKVNQKKKSSLITPMDLIRGNKIRLITICVSGISFVLYFLYYGPLMLIESFGFNIYVNGLLLKISQLLTYVPSALIIDRASRKLVGMIAFGVTLVLSIMLMFVKHTNCDFCLESILQLVFFFGFRFCVSFQFAIFLVYTNELFPAQIVGLGFGVSSAIGSIASTCTPILIGQMKNNSAFHIAILFAISAGMGIIFSMILPQTKGKPLKQFIIELQQNQGDNDLKNDERVQLMQQVRQSRKKQLQKAYQNRRKSRCQIRTSLELLPPEDRQLERVSK